MPNNTQPEQTVRFEYVGLDCKIVKTDMGHWCGYVRRPESVEPVRWQSDYDHKHDEALDAEVDVWGGITYGPDSDGWVGFDDAHSTSVVSQWEVETTKEAMKRETKRLAGQIDSLNPEEANE